MAQTFTKLGLVDEYWFKLQPIVLGKGKSISKDVTKKINLKLIESKAFDSGVITLRYRPA